MVEGNILTHLNASGYSEHDTKGIVVNCAMFKHYTPELYLQENKNTTLYTHSPMPLLKSTHILLEAVHHLGSKANFIKNLCVSLLYMLRLTRRLEIWSAGLLTRIVK